ncbi:hypothetical protein MTO96_035186 [Rhipicephalus appendiculatus]
MCHGVKPVSRGEDFGPRTYSHKAAELSAQQGSQIWRTKVVIPKCLRFRVLQLLQVYYFSVAVDIFLKRMEVLAIATPAGDATSAVLRHVIAAQKWPDAIAPDNDPAFASTECLALLVKERDQLDDGSTLPPCFVQCSRAAVQTEKEAR